jgi:hypothetical protein
VVEIVTCCFSPEFVFKFLGRYSPSFVCQPRADFSGIDLVLLGKIAPGYIQILWHDALLATIWQIFQRVLHCCTIRDSHFISCLATTFLGSSPEGCQQPSVISQSGLDILGAVPGKWMKWRKKFKQVFDKFFISSKILILIQTLLLIWQLFRPLPTRG